MTALTVRQIFPVAPTINLQPAKPADKIHTDLRTNKLDQLFPDQEEAQAKLLQTNIGNKVLKAGSVFQWDQDFSDVVSPIQIRNADGSTKQHLVGQMPVMHEADIADVQSIAKKAWDHGRGDWPSRRLNERCDIMETFVTRMQSQREIIVQLLMNEICKSRKDAEKEFDRTIEYIWDTIHAARTMHKESSNIDQQGDFLKQESRQPIGVVLSMGPFNYPLNETFTTLIPALLMGNIVIYKPAKYGQMVMQALLDIFADVFPKGVINPISGDGAEIITPLMKSGDIDALAFIGSAGVANLIVKSHPNQNRLKQILGLGAKNPAIVLPDADIDLAVEKCLQGALSYNGQRCTALKNIFVHESIADEFAQKLAKRVEELKIGMPYDEGVNITPLPEKGKTKWMDEFVQDALLKGTQIMNYAGGRHNDSIYVPAVLYPVGPEMMIAQNEQFGPVVPIIPFNDVNDVIEFIATAEDQNGHQYGQQASVFATEHGTVSAMVQMLGRLFARLNINDQSRRGPDQWPFGGRRDSAREELSIEGALYALSMSSPVVVTGDNPANRQLLDLIAKER